MIIVLPSRGRPNRLAETLSSVAAVGTPPEIYIRVDSDDPCVEAYKTMPLIENATMAIGPCVSVGGAMNEALCQFPDEDCYGFLGDDAMVRTKDWDRRLRDATGLAGVAYPNDLLKGEALSTHPFVGGNLVRAFGWFSAPGLKRLFMDEIWMLIGKRYGNLTYCPDVIVEHMHWSAGKASNDTTYAKPEKHADRVIYEAWKKSFYGAGIDDRIVRLIEADRHIACGEGSKSAPRAS